MGAIAGYVGGGPALDVVLEGLRRLDGAGEGAGFDSAGVAVVADGGIAAATRAGGLADLDKELADRPLPDARTGIGHLRRAGRGAVSDLNAHPHLDNAGRVAVVHNGTLANSAALRAELSGRGHELVSETDTEAVAHLLAEALSSCGELAEAMRQVCRRLEGGYALVAVHADAPGVAVGACRGAPLAVGVADGDGDGEFHLASGTAAFLAHTRDVVEPDPEPGRIVEVRRGGGVSVTDLDGRAVDARVRTAGEDR